jgi:hypothetical protein
MPEVRGPAFQCSRRESKDEISARSPPQPSEGLIAFAQGGKEARSETCLFGGVLMDTRGSGGMILFQGRREPTAQFLLREKLEKHALQ